MSDTPKFNTIEEAFTSNKALSAAYDLNPEKPLPSIKFAKAGFGDVDIRTLTPATLQRWKGLGKSLPYFIEKTNANTAKATPPAVKS